MAFLNIFMRACMNEKKEKNFIVFVDFFILFFLTISCTSLKKKRRPSLYEGHVQYKYNHLVFENNLKKSDLIFETAVEQEHQKWEEILKIFDFNLTINKMLKSKKINSSQKKVLEYYSDTYSKENKKWSKKDKIDFMLQTLPVQICGHDLNCLPPFTRKLTYKENITIQKKIKFDFTNIFSKQLTLHQSVLNINKIFYPPPYIRYTKIVRNNSYRIDFIETHHRFKGRAGDISELSWKVMDFLNVERRPQHVHILMPAFPIDRAFQDSAHGAVVPLLLHNFVKNLNLLVELYGIYFENDSINRANIEFFTSLNGHSSGGLFKQIDQYFEGLLGNYVSWKSGWVAFHFPKKYEGRPTKAFGLEIRSIDEDYDVPRIKILLNGIQESAFNLSNEIYRINLHKDLSRKFYSNKLNSLDDPEPVSLYTFKHFYSWYLINFHKTNKSFEDVLKKYLLTSYYNNSRNTFDLSFDKNIPLCFHEYEELLLLTHDWSHDPLFFHDKNFLSHMTENQSMYKKKLMNYIEERKRKAECTNKDDTFIKKLIVSFLEDSTLINRVFNFFRFKIVE